MFRWLPVLFLAIACAGCGTMDYRLGPQNFDVPGRKPGEGVVIASAGAAERCTSMSTSLTIAPADQPYAKGGITAIPVDAYVFDSDYADHFGKLSVFSLPPGRYQLYPYLANPYMVPKQVPKWEFSVEAGEVVYIGELFATRSCSSSMLIEVRDEEARDLALLRTRNPAFADVTVVKRLSVEAGLLMGGEAK